MHHPLEGLFILIKFRKQAQQIELLMNFVKGSCSRAAPSTPATRTSCTPRAWSSPSRYAPPTRSTPRAICATRSSRRPTGRSWARTSLLTEICLTLTTQPQQKIRFSEIFFWILNMFAIVSNLQKKKLFFVKTLKNNVSDHQTTNPNKTFLIVGTAKKPC